MALADDLARIAEAASAHGRDGDRLTAVLATEPAIGDRLYLCAFENDAGARAWLAVDDAGEVVTDRQAVRDGVSIAALCEVAEEVAAGGDLDELRSQLVALRLSENPEGIDEAEAAALELQHVLGSPPALATPARLDAIGLATRRLELALGGVYQGSPFAGVMRGAGEVVDALTSDVERSYLADLR